MMKRKVGIVGLGYVGLPVAMAFGNIDETIGFDINEYRVSTLNQFVDYTGEISEDALRNTRAKFTADETELRKCNFIIIAVPTPVDKSKKPDLSLLEKATDIVGRNMQRNTIVVYESTVYPGATEEVCLPILEDSSGFVSGRDFFIGYSPERINPGDREHTFENIIKVVSGQDEIITNIIAEVYGKVVKAGVFKAASIKVAEAAKVIENTQRDLNIALMNELSIIFNKLNIDTHEVLEAASTKWNFLKFTPGLVGGHCIGVDPYYLTYKAESVGYHPQVILSGRRINDGMGQYVATTIVKEMILKGISVQGSHVIVLGMTFKENVPDIRNTKVIDIINELKEFGIKVSVSDPIANGAEMLNEYGVSLVNFDDLEDAEAIVLAVPHEFFLRLGWDGIRRKLKEGTGIVADVKGRLDSRLCPKNITCWRL